MNRFHVLVFKFLIIITVLALIFVLKFKRKTREDNNEIYKLPRIELKELSGEAFSLSKHEKPRTIVMFFSPSCDYCEQEIAEIILNKIYFSEVLWIFITQSFFADELKTFLISYPIDKLENAVVLLEDFPYYHNKYSVVGPPALFIYDENLELIYENRGLVGIELLKRKIDLDN